MPKRRPMQSRVGNLQKRGKLGKFDQAQFAVGKPTIAGRKSRIARVKARTDIGNKKRKKRLQHLRNKLVELRTIRKDASRRAK